MALIIAAATETTQRPGDRSPVGEGDVSPLLAAFSMVTWVLLAALVIAVAAAVARDVAGERHRAIGRRRARLAVRVTTAVLSPKEMIMSTRDYDKKAEQAKHDAERAKEDMRRAAERGGEAAKGAAAHAKETLEEGASKVAATLHDASDTVEAKTREVASSVKEQIEAKPMTSTLTALGIGVFIGWLLASRR